MGERPVNEAPRDGTSPALSAIWLAEPFVAHESPTFETGVQARVGLRDLPVGASDRKGVPTTGVVRDDDSHRLRSNKRDEEVDSAIRARISERDCGSRSEARRVGKEGVSPCSSGWSQYH